MNYTEKHIITLNSNEVSNKYNDTYLSNVDFAFPSLLKPDDDILFSEILLVKAEIPVSFYTINSTNNILNYFLTTNKTITITLGNYNANSFITELNTQFLANSDTFTITIKSSNGLLTFSNSTAFSFISTGSTVLSTLGFLNQNYSSVSNALTAPFPLNLLGIKRISIKSNQLLANNFTSTNKGLDSVLGVIQVNQPSFGLIVYETQQQDGHLLRNKSLSKIDIQLLDENNNFINFNNIGWTITLMLCINRIVPIPTTKKINE